MTSVTAARNSELLMSCIPLVICPTAAHSLPVCPWSVRAEQSACTVSDGAGSTQHILLKQVRSRRNHILCPSVCNVSFVPAVCNKRALAQVARSVRDQAWYMTVTGVITLGNEGARFASMAAHSGGPPQAQAPGPRNDYLAACRAISALRELMKLAHPMKAGLDELNCTTIHLQFTFQALTEA